MSDIDIENNLEREALEEAEDEDMKLLKENKKESPQ